MLNGLLWVVKVSVPLAPIDLWRCEVRAMYGNVVRSRWWFDVVYSLFAERLVDVEGNWCVWLLLW